MTELEEEVQRAAYQQAAKGLIAELKWTQQGHAVSTCPKTAGHVGAAYALEAVLKALRGNADDLRKMGGSDAL